MTVEEKTLFESLYNIPNASIIFSLDDLCS